MSNNNQMRRENVYEAIRQNEMNTCIATIDAAGRVCGKPRTGMSNFCIKHRQQQVRTGAAGYGSQMLLKKDIRPYATECRHLILLNLKHPVISRPLEWIERLAYNTTHDIHIPGLNLRAHRYLGNVFVHEPDLVDVLSYLVGVALIYYTRQGFANRFNFYRNVGNILIRFVRGKNPNRLSYKSARQISTYVHNNIGTYLARIADAVVKRNRQAEEMRKMEKQLLRLFADHERFDEELDNELKREFDEPGVSK
jgi:hypothetical protein